MGILCGILWKVIRIWKELICLSRFLFSSRFWGNGEGRKKNEFKSLEVQEASSLHLKTSTDTQNLEKQVKICQGLSYKKIPL